MLLLQALVLAVAGFVPARAQEQKVKEETESVRIEARRFKFVPSRITVEAGKTLEIALSSQDVAHGFRVPGTSVDVEIPARGKGETRVTLRLAEPGKYRFECSTVCGAGHSSMRGVIVVREKPEEARRLKERE